MVDKDLASWLKSNIEGFIGAIKKRDLNLITEMHHLPLVVAEDLNFIPIKNNKELVDYYQNAFARCKVFQVITLAEVDITKIKSLSNKVFICHLANKSLHNEKNIEIEINCSINREAFKILSVSYNSN